MVQPVLIAGEWRQAKAAGTFHAQNPATGESLPGEYPVSSWDDCDAALDAAARAAVELRSVAPDAIAALLNRFADRLDARKTELCQVAHLETALPVSPRLADVELPRTTGQLRQAAAAALEGSWALPTIDTKANIRSLLAPIGPVVVFGPNNFPFAFSAVAGGDCAAAIAAGNPVIAKGHPLQPATTKMLGEEAAGSVADTGLPPGLLQVLYHLEPESGLRLVADGRVGASAFTGSRAGGLALKAAADKAGTPIYLELSSINPVVFLPGLLEERGAAVAEEYAASALLGGGQFCTNPGLAILFESAAAEQFAATVKRKFDTTAPVPLLSVGVVRGLTDSVRVLKGAGAELITADTVAGATGGCLYPNTLLRVTGKQFLARPDALQTEAFGSAVLLVVVRDGAEAAAVIEHLDGSLTGSIYSAQSAADESLYAELAPRLRQRVGRLLNDKMPTGVAVSPAMQHGGPYPSTGHPGFTAVGIPASLKRFAALQSYDNVRQHRLPAALQDRNLSGAMWRLIDGQWTRSDVGA
jgi:alpha-ketoglutaric semialdehyde dehydrogenase